MKANPPFTSPPLASPPLSTLKHKKKTTTWSFIIFGIWKVNIIIRLLRQKEGKNLKKRIVQGNLWYENEIFLMAYQPLLVI